MATRKKRFSKVAFNQSLVIDVIGASLVVQIAPGLINKFLPIDESLTNLAGAGAGYLLGSMLKRPDLANASIGLGVVGFISPMVSGLISGGDVTAVTTTTSAGASPMLPTRDGTLEDVFRLNDYVSSPLMQVNAAYKNSY